MISTPSIASRAKLVNVFAGVSVFLMTQYLIALWRLATSSSGMENKFSALARDEYMGFLVSQNLLMVAAYAVLAVAGSLLIQPFVEIMIRRIDRSGRTITMICGFIFAAIIHGYFILRLVETRPYFLNQEEFGAWYYQGFNLLPESIRPSAVFVFSSILPTAVLVYAIQWHTRRHGKKGLAAAALASVAIPAAYGFAKIGPSKAPKVSGDGKPMNVLIIGSDSLRGDRLGCAGYVPRRKDGMAAAGVSPVIDALAEKSIRFENCYTAIASTMESGTQLMSSQYPQSHGIRQMYPDRKTVEATNQKIVPITRLLRKIGYDTRAIGDWCAGYYEVLPMDFEHISVSSFDNFKIYMSQAVVLAHFVVPLYFDNAFGYLMFPQLGAFAQFVTPEVVSERVEKRLALVAKQQKPFFWHVFYSCNHLPYRSREPYRSIFADPNYEGRNRNGVDFDIDSFIGGTDLESKWKALPPKEIDQIRALYDGCTRQFDDCVARILASLKANGLDQNTIVIVTADHGDDHYEPGVTLGHGLTFNGGNQANHVPLIVYLPGAAPQVIPETVRLIDIIPTIADLLEVEKSATWQGQSFAGWMKQTEKPVARPFYGETGFPFIQFTVPGVTRPKLPPMDELTHIDKNFNYQFVLKEKYVEPLVQAKQRCLRTRKWKVVCTPTIEGNRHFGLFEMATDPHGKTDLATEHPEVLTPMRTALERWMDEKYESPIAEIFPNGEP